jgi:hypothetical protein
MLRCVHAYAYSAPKSINAEGWHDGQAMQDIVRSQPSGHDDRQVAACELIEHDEHTESQAVLTAAAIAPSAMLDLLTCRS